MEQYDRNELNHKRKSNTNRTLIRIDNNDNFNYFLSMYTDHYNNGEELIKSLSTLKEV